MNTKFILIAYCLLCLFGCYRNPPERNKIVFRDKLKNVQDSLFKMERLLPKLPRRADRLNINYSIKNGQLSINDTLLINDLIVDFNGTEKNEFISLAYYLNKNFISGAYSGYSPNSWNFIYREKKNDNFNDSRNIVLLDNKNSVSAYDSIIDKNDQIYLIVGKGAFVR